MAILSIYWERPYFNIKPRKGDNMSKGYCSNLRCNNDGRTSSHPDQGGNWPSTTGNPSGGGRGNG